MKYRNVVTYFSLLVVGACCVSCGSTPPSPVRGAVSGSGGATSISAAAAPAMPMLAPHLPAPVAAGRAASMGALSLDQRLQFAIHLPLRNTTELARLLHDLYDPTSPSFHRYLTVSEFTERFGPTSTDGDARGYAVK